MNCSVVEWDWINGRWVSFCTLSTDYNWLDMTFFFLLKKTSNNKHGHEEGSRLGAHFLIAPV